MAAGFPLPQYPPTPALLSTVSPPDLDARSHASLSPDSKETTGSADSPGQAENLSDSNSEKRRSRKQKPRKMIFGEQEREENTETEEEGGSSRDRSPRDRHQSASSSYRDDGLPMQQVGPDNWNVSLLILIPILGAGRPHCQIQGHSQGRGLPLLQSWGDHVRFWTKK